MGGNGTSQPVTRQARDLLLGQFDMAWKLTAFHLDGLTTKACLWRPASEGLHVRQGADGAWRADWPDRETYDIGPASIGWLTWHMVFWWSMTLDHAFGEATLSRQDMLWPGNASAVRQRLGVLREHWRAALEQASDEDLLSSARVRWPFSDRSLGELAAWLNLELMKNGAEIGYARFLYAAREMGSA
jgi:hypothetical protein